MVIADRWRTSGVSIEVTGEFDYSIGQLAFFGFG